MSFVFATSHLPEVERPKEEEEEEENMQPMLRAGGVRAFSHLEEAQAGSARQTLGTRSRADSTLPTRTMGAPCGSLSQRSAQPIGRSLFTTPRPTPPQAFAQLQAPRAGASQPPPPATTEEVPAAGQGATPTFRNLPQRSSDQPPAQLLAQTDATKASSPGRPAAAPGTTFQQAVAKPGTPPQRAQSSPSTPPTRPASATTPAPQTPAQGGNPSAQAPAVKPAPAQGAPPPPNPAAKPQRPLTDLEKKELLTKDGRVRKPIGQLGITASPRIGDPNRTPTGKKPRTVCLYDGQEKRQNDDGKCIANAYSLKQAAATYASADNWMIDISNKDWDKQLEALRASEEKNGGIDRIMLFDHGGPAYQEFGDQRLEPTSPEWKKISSSVRVGGDIVLGGCEVARKDWRGDGPAYLDELYRNSSVSHRPKIHAYDENVRHREGRWLHSVTAGEEHTIPLD